MARNGNSNSDEWTARIVRDPAQREREFRRAARIETVFSAAAAGFVFLAVWGFTTSAPFFGVLESGRAGGMALLCYTGCMAIAAGGGIKKRLISLVSELETRQH